jgi:peptidoglycan/xylan/chitin deacetylase (PgdA/CDA1 family)
VFNGRAVSYQTFVRGFDSVRRLYEEFGYSDLRLARKHPGDEGRRLWSLPERGSRARWIATMTVRHPGVARRLGDLVRPAARRAHERGATGPLARKVTYSLLFDHRYWLGVASAGGSSELGLGSRSELLVLAYHGFTPSAEPDRDRHVNAPAEVLAQVGAILRDGWELVTPDEVAGFLERRHGLPLRSLLLTFDDGYRDLSAEGAKVLAELGAGALAFVVTGLIGGESSWAGVGAAPLLTADQLGTLSAAGVEIGAHSRTHPELTSLPDDRLQDETEGPVGDLERLGLPTPRFMAYPHGDHDERVRGAAAAYLGAFTVDPGIAGSDGDRWRLPRISVRTGTSPEELVRQVRALRWKARRRRLRGAVRAWWTPARPTPDGTAAERRPTPGRASRGSRSG